MKYQAQNKWSEQHNQKPTDKPAAYKQTNDKSPNVPRDN